MNNDRFTHGLWETSALVAPHTMPLGEDIQVDVAVIGGGYTGLSAALHLHQGGAKVAVLEAEEIGFGGSGRNVGLVNAGMWVMPDDLPKELGDVYGERLLNTLGNAPSLVFDLVNKYGIDCMAIKNGTLHCAVGESGYKEIKDRFQQWKVRGASVFLLDAKETAKRTGTTAYTGALLDMRAGTIQPLSYARGLAQAVIAEGTPIYTKSAISEVKDLGGSAWQLKTKTGHTVTAKWAVVATNAFTNMNGLWQDIRRELIHLPYFNLATEPLPLHIREQILPGLEGAWDTKQVLSSYRYGADGRLVFGSVGALADTGLKIHENWGKRELLRLFPQLEQVKFDSEWYGWIGMTTNALPRFHELARNTVAFCGYNGRGIAPGTVLGKELSQLILGKITQDELSLPVSVPQEPRFRSAREAYINVGSQIAHAAGARF